MDANALTRDIEAGLSYAELKQRHGMNSAAIADFKRSLGLKMRRQVQRKVPETTFEQLLSQLVKHMKNADVSRVVLNDDGKVEIHRAKRIQVV